MQQKTRNFDSRYFKGGIWHQIPSFFLKEKRVLRENDKNSFLLVCKNWTCDIIDIFLLASLNNTADCYYDHHLELEHTQYSCHA
jgi:hypothetical protein